MHEAASADDYSLYDTSSYDSNAPTTTALGSALPRCAMNAQTQDTIEYADANVSTESCYKTSMTTADQATVELVAESVLRDDDGDDGDDDRRTDHTARLPAVQYTLHNVYRVVFCCPTWFLTYTSYYTCS